MFQVRSSTASTACEEMYAQKIIAGKQFELSFASSRWTILVKAVDIHLFGMPFSSINLLACYFKQNRVGEGVDYRVCMLYKSGEG
jgi:hypothetical protein